MQKPLLTKIHYHFNELDSTNGYANRHFLKHGGVVEDIVVITTNHQTLGRGQSGNHWHDEANNNLLISFLIKPLHIPIDETFYLHIFSSLAVINAIESLIDKEKRKLLSIKWPNDIYYENKKLGGMLIENSIMGSFIRFSIIGIGINVNQKQFPDNLPNPISITQIQNKKIEIEQLTQLVKNKFEEFYIYSLADEELFRLKEMYLERLLNFRTWAWYKFGNNTIKARIEDVELDGRLRLIDESNKVYLPSFKEISFILNP